jgi:ferredoxin
MMSLRLKVDTRRCHKSGECYYNHPELLVAGADGYPRVLAPELRTARQRIEAEQAIEVCPTQALAVVEE